MTLFLDVAPPPPADTSLLGIGALAAVVGLLLFVADALRAKEDRR